VWIKDPLTNQPSVALTLLMIATALMLGGIAMECFTNLRSTHLLDELFGSAIALYGGHLITFRNSGPTPPN
jgi:hypothetical protein